MGVANVYSKNGSIYYQLPNGKITTEFLDTLPPFFQHQGFSYDKENGIFFNRQKNTIVSLNWALDHVDQLFDAVMLVNKYATVWANESSDKKELIDRYLPDAS